MLDVLSRELKKQRALALEELENIRAAHAEELTPPRGTPLPPQMGGSIPRRDP